MSDKFTSAWTAFSGRQKVSIAVTSLVVLGSVVYIPFIIKAPVYGVLFSSVSDQDAGQIIARLKADGIPYKLGPSGKRIFIPETKVEETRFRMAMANLPVVEQGNDAVLDDPDSVFFSGLGDDRVTSLSGTRYETAEDVERRLETKAQTMLDKILGPHKSIVRVSVDTDSNRINTEEEAVEPAGAVSVQQAGGPGPRGMGEREINAGSRDNKDAAINNNDDGKTIPSATQEAEDIKRMTVAVVVDGKYRAYGSDPHEKIYIPRNEEEIMKLTDLVQGAVNFNSARGDEIKIQNIPFDTAYEDEIRKGSVGSVKKSKAGSGNPFMVTAVKGGKVLALSLVVFLGMRKIAGMRPKDTAVEKKAPDVPMSKAEPGIEAVSRIPSAPSRGMPGLEAEEIANNIKKLWLTS